MSDTTSQRSSKFSYCLFACYILFAGFTDFLAITPILSIPTCLTIGIFGYLFFFRRFFLFKLSVTDILLIVLGIIVVLSYIANLFFLGFNPKAANHLFAYLFTISFTYFSFKFFSYQLIKKHILDFKKISRLFFYATFLISLYTILEYVLRNFFGVKLDAYLPYASGGGYEALAVGEYFRARGTIVESGHLALYLELFAPIGIYFCFFSINGIPKLVKLLYVVVIFLAFGLTFSTIGFLIVLAIAGCFSLKFIFLVNVKKRQLLFFVLFVFAIIGTIIYFGDSIIKIIQDTTIDKFSSGSASDRSDRLVTMNIIFSKGSALQKIIGFGPGGYDTVGIDSIVNLYPNLLFELGLAGVICFLLMLLFTLISLFQIKDRNLRNVFLVSFFSGTFHYLAVNNYYYSWFWVIIALGTMARTINQNDELPVDKKLVLNA